jgi:hypothetical protein
MLTNIFHHQEKMQTYMETQQVALLEKDSLIKQLIAENKQQLETFDKRVANIQVTAPQPDLSGVYKAIETGLAGVSKVVGTQLSEIKATIENGPKPITRKWQLFSDQLRSPEYYKTIFSWSTYCILGIGFLIAAYGLLTHLMNLHAGK